MRKQMLIAVTAFVSMVPSTSDAQIDTYVEQACEVSARACELGNDLARRMMRCLQLPSNGPDSFKMLARVMLQDGEAIFISVGFDALRPSAWEQQAGPAVADAIAKCEPYAGLSGPAVFVVTPTLLRSAPTP